MLRNKVILKVYIMIIRYVVGLQIKASTMFLFRWLIEVAISYWTDRVLENSKSAMIVYGKLIISVCCRVMSDLAQGFTDSSTINSNYFHETIFNHSVFP